MGIPMGFLLNDGLEVDDDDWRLTMMSSLVNFLIEFKDSEEDAVELLYVEELMERLDYDYEQMDNVRAHLYEKGSYVIEGEACITYTFSIASTGDMRQYEDSWKFHDGNVGKCKKQDWAKRA